MASSSRERDPAWFWPEIEASIVGTEYRGHESLGTVRVGAHELRTRLPIGFSVPADTRVDIGFDLARGSWFATDSGLAIRHESP